MTAARISAVSIGRSSAIRVAKVDWTFGRSSSVTQPPDLHAAIAGVWRFVSGLASGLFRIGALKIGFACSEEPFFFAFAQAT